MFDGLLKREAAPDGDAASPASLAISCGLPPLAAAAEEILSGLGFDVRPDAPTTLLLDAPQSHALYALERLGKREAGEGRLIVVTWNPCVEHLEDLWDREPDVLLAGQYLDTDPTDVLRRVLGGERFRMTPGSPSPLTPVERGVLRLVARGWGNKRIAAELHVQEQTVSNTLTRAYHKLDLDNRADAALYYWGIPRHESTDSARS